MMKLTAYLERIGYSGSLSVDLDCLNALIAGHIREISFENLDVIAERPVSLATERIFDKLVTRRRGGWCYEMNGLFEWVLQQVGFKVRRLTAGVRRVALGDEALGNHLALIVELDQPYLVDVGFGSSQAYALPIAEGVTTHRPLQIALAKTDDGYWRLHEGGADAFISYDFKPDWTDEALLKARHDWQVNNPASIFRKMLLVKRRLDDTHMVLNGRMLELLKPGRKETRELASASDLEVTLREQFGIDEPECERLWPIICERHDLMHRQAGEAGKPES